MAIKDIKEIDYPQVYDLDYRGGIDAQGFIRETWGDRALVNSLKLWISSFKGDLINNLNTGGRVVQHLLKPMRQVDIQNFKQSIRDGIAMDYGPTLKIKKLEITPNYEERVFEIYMEVYSKELKYVTGLYEKIKGV